MAFAGRSRFGASLAESVSGPAGRAAANFAGEGAALMALALQAIVLALGAMPGIVAEDESKEVL
jgi:hypothetical protein